MFLMRSPSLQPWSLVSHCTKHICLRAMNRLSAPFWVHLKPNPKKQLLCKLLWRARNTEDSFSQDVGVFFFTHWQVELEFRGLRRVWLSVCQDLIVDQTIEKVSFCAPDRNYDKAFSYICRDGTTRRWMCHCFMALKDSVGRSHHLSASYSRLLKIIYFQQLYVL